MPRLHRVGCSTQRGGSGHTLPRPVGTAERRLMTGRPAHSTVPTRLECSSTERPSVETLGYIQLLLRGRDDPTGPQTTCSCPTGRPQRRIVSPPPTRALSLLVIRPPRTASDRSDTRPCARRRD